MITSAKPLVYTAYNSVYHLTFKIQISDQFAWIFPLKLALFIGFPVENDVGSPEISIRKSAVEYLFVMQKRKIYIMGKCDSTYTSIKQF